MLGAIECPVALHDDGLMVRRPTGRIAHSRRQFSASFVDSEDEGLSYRFETREGSDAC